MSLPPASEARWELLTLVQEEVGLSAWILTAAGRTALVVRGW